MAAQAGEGRAWLDVPFSDKDQAKALGARWHPGAKRWYAPPHAQPGLARWAARPEIPRRLPGEDRTFGAGLFTDLIPSTSWFNNVRTAVSPTDWERLRRMLLARARHRCEICGRGEDRDRQQWLEAHERFAYDERTGVQHLRRLLIACSWCHRATHMGHATITGQGEDAFAHLCTVTGMSAEDAEAHIEDAYAQWQERSTRSWSVDLRMLTGAGLTVTPPPTPEQRWTAGYQQLLAEHRAELGLDPDAPSPAELAAGPIPHPTSEPGEPVEIPAPDDTGASRPPEPRGGW